MYTTGKGPSPAGAVRVHARRGAFTLVEIIVVLMIMAVVLTMTSVSLSGAMGGVAARESAGRLLMALRYARSYATIHGCPCRVTFSRQAGSYELTCQPDAGQEKFEALPGGRHASLDQHVRFVDIVIQPGQSGQQGSDVIIFEPTGECNGARIQISDGRAVYTVIVSSGSGMVRLHKGPSDTIASDREDLG